MDRFRVRAYDGGDWSQWLRMSLALYPHHTADELADGMRAFQARADAAVFVAEQKGGALVGFVEIGARPYADGCVTTPVGYIEAWFVHPDARRQGCGVALLRAAGVWARQRGYRELASDTRVDNDVSYAAHRRAGFEEVERVVQFRKPVE